MLAPAVVAVAYRLMPPPGTPLMIIRWSEGEGIEKSWVPLARISTHLQRAVVAAEDARFCDHFGFDWIEMRRAFDEYRRRGRMRGASTITMQTAKNLYLWPSRDPVRKGLEAYIAPQLEVILGKRRILEIYLNIVEWGPGVYGSEAAARRYFAKPAARLEPREAALLAAVLPKPRGWSPVAPTEFIAERAAEISREMRLVPVGPGVCSSG